MHTTLCRHHSFLGRIAHFLASPPNLRTRSQYNSILFLWNFGPWEHPNRCWIDVSEQVTPMAKLTFGGPEAQPDKMTPLVRDLFSIKGVASVTLSPYKVILDKGRTFSWMDIQQPVEDVLRRHLTS